MQQKTWTKGIVCALAIAFAALAPSGCKKNESAKKAAVTIQCIGSDTMVNLAQAWAEAYAKKEPGISVEVSGGGSGVGIAALLNGTADIANASRKLEADEVEKAKKTLGGEPKEVVVGFDALAVYVHKDNPLTQISIEELSEIFREGGTISKWSQLGVSSMAGDKGDEIVRVSRQNNSGTYHYFREVVVGKKADFRRGSLDMNGSKEVVELIEKTPTAIGYSGMGYATKGVKRLAVSKKKGEPGVPPSIATTLDHSYPIARPLYVYTPAQPPAHVTNYITWLLSVDGQKLVEETGYVPLPK